MTSSSGRRGSCRPNQARVGPGEHPHRLRARSGYYGDSAITVGVGEISDQARKLLAVTEAALYEGIKHARSGNRLGAVSNAIETYAEKAGFSVVPGNTSAHGIGRQMQRSPG